MRKPKIVLILGTAGSGKSYFLGKVLSRERRTPILCITRFPDPSITGRFRAPLLTPSRLPRTYLRLPKRLILNLEIFTTEELKLWQKVIAGTLEKTGGTLAIDEGHIFLRHGQVTPELIRLIRGSRHYEVAVYIATQRLVDVAADIRSVVSDLIIFKTTSQRDLEYLQLELGFNPLELRSLRTGEALWLDRLSGKLLHISRA